MAESSYSQADLLEVFGLFVEKDKAKADLPAAEKKVASLSAVKKMMVSCKIPKENITRVETVLFAKHADKKTKKITDTVFFETLLPELAAGDEAKLKKWCTAVAGQKEVLKKAKEAKSGGSTVDRLTDTKNYTGSSAARFGKDGKGLGKEGREDMVANDGYVGAYKNKDTYGTKK